MPNILRSVFLPLFVQNMSAAVRNDPNSQKHCQNGHETARHAAASPSARRGRGRRTACSAAETAQTRTSKAGTTWARASKPRASRAWTAKARAASTGTSWPGASKTGASRARASSTRTATAGTRAAASAAGA